SRSSGSGRASCSPRRARKPCPGSSPGRGAPLAAPASPGPVRVPYGRLPRAPPAHELRVRDELLDLRRRIAPGRLLDVPALLPRDLGEEPAREHRARRGRDDVLGRRRGVAMLDEEPRGPIRARAGPGARADEDPRAAELLPM